MPDDLTQNETGSFTLHADFPDAPSVSVTVSGWTAPIYALSALKKVGSEETLQQVAEALDQKIQEAQQQ